MAHAPKQVAPHLLPLYLPLGDLHLLCPAGQSAGQDGNGHHHQKGQGKARQSEADLPVGLGENIVHAQNTQHGAKKAEQISLRQHRRQKHICQKQHGHIAGVPSLVQGTQQQAGDDRGQIQTEGNNEVLGRIDQIVALPDQSSFLFPLLRPRNMKPLSHKYPLPILNQYSISFR